MGCLRMLLALLVLFSHTPQLVNVMQGFNLIGWDAVECFFVISGFYIQMIIHEQYVGQSQWQWKFLKSRFLRIFVPYWVVIFSMVLVTILFHSPEVAGKRLPLLDLWMHQPFSKEAVLSTISNLSILSIDDIKIDRILEGCTSFYWNHTIIGSMWSVGLELMFYLLAPWLLLCRTRVLVVAAIGSLCAKEYFLMRYPSAPFYLECADSFMDAIFPMEIGLFLAGSLGYRCYVRFLKGRVIKHPKLWLSGLYSVIVLGTALSVTSLAIYLYDHKSRLLIGSYYAFVLLVIMIAPFLFKLSRSLKWDRLIGNLSYPFYLCHSFFIEEISRGHFFSSDKHPIFWAIVVFTLAAMATGISALLVEKFVEIPLTAFRHRHFRRTQGDSTP